MSLPLEGVKVLDFTAIMAGPYCTLMLADMGAEVTKIETFPEGDGSRGFDPKVNGESYCFAVLNRNKRSLALDLKDARGKEVFMKLARDADIVIENYRPGVTRNLGIDYPAIRAINPGIIYASISGFGQTGPYSNKGGYDIIAQGVSGIMTMTGEPCGRPAKVGIAMNDIAAGTTALYSILGAYIKRMRTGEGVYLETSLLEAGLAWTYWEFGAYFGGGEVPIATGVLRRSAGAPGAHRGCAFQDARHAPEEYRRAPGRDRAGVCHAPHRALGEEARRRGRTRRPGVRLRAGIRQRALEGAQHGGRDRAPEDRAHENTRQPRQGERRTRALAYARAVARPAQRRSVEGARLQRGADCITVCRWRRVRQVPGEGDRLSRKVVTITGDE
jgi:hypothetical protein